MAQPLRNPKAADKEHDDSHHSGDAKDHKHDDAMHDAEHHEGEDHGAGHGDGRDFNAAPLYFSASLFLFTLVLFGGYFVIMRQVAWQPIIEGLNEREARVQVAEHDAATAKAEAARFQQQADDRLAQVHNEVKSIVTQGPN